MDWQSIYEHLKAAGFDVYALGQHQGVCAKPYIVLRANGIYQGLGIEQVLYELLLYYPADYYYRFEEYISRVKKAMNLIYPQVKLVDPETPHYLDPDVMGFMTSLTYGIKKISEINRMRKE
ncbi:MAG: hypothetical protein HFE39_09625 [Clostridiales bacterium]|jgi:hypothetical protein|nr:hypothetical protein [Clostridiales bacterium]